MVNGFTNIQKKMLAVLQDGMPHTPQELHACLMDELGPISNIGAHLTGIRKKLRPTGYDVMAREGGEGTRYMMVRLLCKS